MTGRRDPSEYKFVVAEVGWDPRKKEGRLNPIAGEVFPQDMYIECSKALRALPPTTKVRLKVVVKNPKSEDDSPHLYTSYKWNYELIK
ncbi:hypothetical protein [Plesiomonas shigelloides]|uniref:hypothetical protein n=1 Tax=Plesiomonas shigelloides TaxID=703 RepID=UPI001C455E82|nr:hypothetical protein [Plesiomonas shigelloides]